MTALSLLLLGFSGALAAAQAQAVFSIGSGRARLEIRAVDGGYGACLRRDGGVPVYEQSRMLAVAVEVVDEGGAATDAFQVYRLSLFTGDTNLLNEARLMLYNTKQSLDWDARDPRSNGDAGLFNKAMTLVVPRGHGVKFYLPWQTANVMEPMTQLFDVFGSHSIDAIEQQPLAIQRARNEDYARNRGYDRPASGSVHTPE